MKKRDRQVYKYHQKYVCHIRVQRLKLMAVVCALIFVTCLSVVLWKSRSSSEYEQFQNTNAVQVAQNQTSDEKSEPLQTKKGILSLDTFDFKRAALTANKSEDVHQMLTYILSHPQQYPEVLLEDLAFNPEVLQYVYDYPSNIDAKTASATNTHASFDTTNNGIPLYLQFDQRWGYTSYGEGESLGWTGCGPTCVAMVASGLTHRYVSPETVAQFSANNNLYVENQGTSWELMTLAATKYGLSAKQMPVVTAQTIYSNLKHHRPIICSMRRGDFTISGHFIVLVGITDDNQLIINDPNSLAHSQKTWPLNRVLNQIVAAWVYSA